LYIKKHAKKKEKARTLAWWETMAEKTLLVELFEEGGGTDTKGKD